MAQVDDDAWFQLISAQRRLPGANLGPDPISRPAGFLAPAINAELAMVIAKIKREGG